MFSTIKVSDQAPIFNLKGYHNKKNVTITLEDIKSKWVVLFFYPSDFSSLTTKELKSFEKNYINFTQKNTEIVACSVDSPIIHEAFVESIGELSFPLVSDIHHTTCMDYNVYDEDNARAFSGVFIINPKGILTWYSVNDGTLEQNSSDILKSLELLQK